VYGSLALQITGFKSMFNIRDTDLEEMMPRQCNQSGLNTASDYPSLAQKEARIGLRFKITPNQPYFANRTK